MTDIHVTTMSFKAALAELKRQEALRDGAANDARELELDELETQPTTTYPADLQAAYKGSNNRAWPCADGYAQQNADQLEWYKNLGRGLAPAKRHMPSRDFLVRQACLNVAATEMPVYVRTKGASVVFAWLMTVAWPDHEPTPRWVDDIQTEFNKLAGLYQ